MMEILAFTYLAADYEAPISNHQHGRIRMPSLPSSAWMTVAALTLALSGFATAPSAIALVRQGDVGSEVSALQTSLQNLGYPVGSIDGIFGNGTKNAVMRFQQQHGLTVDGIVGNQTLAKIAELENNRSDTSATAVENNSTPSSGASGGSSTVLRLGDSGPSVTSLQTKLKDLGFFPADVAVSEYYGPITVNAVNAFQQAENLVVDGIAGPTTQTALATAQPSVAVTPTPTETPTPTATPDSTPPAETPTVASTAGMLRQGDSGEAVTTLQAKLRQLNHFSLVPTGYYGPVTTDSVRVFQRSQNLVVDGIAGPVTLARLDEVSATANGNTAQTSEADTTTDSPRVTVTPPSPSESVAVEEVVDASAESSATESSPTANSTAESAAAESSAVTTSGGVVTVRATNGLRIRMAPSDQAQIDGLLLDGTSVAVTGEQVGDWLEISPRGWIHQDYVVR